MSNLMFRYLNEKQIKILSWKLSPIVFWIILILLLPIIIFFFKFDIYDLDNIDKFGMFGSYLSGFSGYYTAIFSFLSILILMLTLIITLNYNNEIISSSTQEIKIRNIELLCKIIKNSFENKRINSAYELISNLSYNGKKHTNEFDIYNDIDTRKKLKDKNDVYKYAISRFQTLSINSDLDLSDEILLLEELINILIALHNDNNRIGKTIITGYLPKDIRFILYCYSLFKNKNLNLWAEFKELPKKYNQILITNATYQR